MNRRTELQFLRGELVWIPGDFLRLFREEADAPVDPERADLVYDGPERGCIYRDHPLKVRSWTYSEDKHYPSPEATLEDGWHVDAS